MYRSKSSVSLRSLAYSLKQSINFDHKKCQNRQFIPLRNSSSTINLANNKNHNKNKNNFDQEYLIMLDTRKSRFGSKSIVERQSNVNDFSYNLKSTKQLIQRKQKLLQMTKCQQTTTPTLDMAWHSNILPVTKKQHDQTMLTLNLLQKQYTKTKQNLQKNLSTINFKTYNKLLQQSDNLTNELKAISQKETQFIEHEKQTQNRILFINQQLYSIEMNFTEDLAEKQYCEEFLYRYENAHESHLKQQALNVMKMISLEIENKKIQEEKLMLEKNLLLLERDFKEWKVQQNLQLKQKRFENKFKQHRIQLMKIQQHLDHFTQEIAKNLSQEFDHSVRKVRQYICSYFKKYNQMNINHISHGQIADGIDIFLSKEGLINDFAKYLKEKTQKVALINGTYSLKLTQYCDCLKKIQNLFSIQKNQINTVLSRKFQQKIIDMKQTIENLGIQNQKNLAQMKNLQENIEIVLAQQSLSMIELINKGENSQNLYNKKQGFFNLQQIKSKVKEMKLQQIKRVKRVKEIYLRLKKLQQKQTKYAQLNQKKIQTLISQKQLLKKEILIWKKKISEIQSIKKGYETKKQKCDQLIDEAITKMKEKDQAEKTLKALQTQIEKLKKQKIQNIKQRHMQNKSIDLLGGLRANLNKKESISRMNFFDQTRKILSRNILSDRLRSNLKIDTLKSSPKIKHQSSDQKASAQFCIMKNKDTAFDEEKMSNRTQSSPKSSKERISLGALNSILLSKCNLVESKNMVPNLKKPLKKSESMFKMLEDKKQNPLHSKQSFRKLTQNSARSSKKSNKQNISRKTSVSKNTQRSTIKYGQKRVTPIKLSIDSNRKTQTLKIQRNFSKSKVKDHQTKANKKDINTIISNKLLRR